MCFFNMAATQLIERCCRRHIDADLKSRTLEVTFANIISYNLNNEERDCLYRCDGYNYQCSNYIQYKEDLAVKQKSI